jgi:hypothetical protein
MEFFSILLPLFCLYFHVFLFFSCCFCCCALRPDQELRSPSSYPISLHSVTICSPLCNATHLLEIGWVFRSSFVKTRSSLFGQFPTITCHSTLFLGLSASQCQLLWPNLTTTCRCVDLTRLPVFAKLHSSAVATVFWSFCCSLVVFLIYCCFVLLLCFVGYCLLAFYWFVSLVQTFITELVLVPLFTTVLFTDFSSAFIASASFRWLLLVTSGGSNRFALICAPFASETTLRDPLRGRGHLFVPFPTFCNYFRTALVCFGSIIGEPTPFSFLGSFPPSFRIRGGKDPSI